MEDRGWKMAKTKKDGARSRHPPSSILVFLPSARRLARRRLGGDFCRGDGTRLGGGLALGGLAGGGRLLRFLLRPVPHPLHLDLRADRVGLDELRGLVEHSEVGGEVFAVDEQ